MVGPSLAQPCRVLPGAPQSWLLGLRGSAAQLSLEACLGDGRSVGVLRGPCAQRAGLVTSDGGGGARSGVGVGGGSLDPWGAGGKEIPADGRGPVSIMRNGLSSV